jgi:hypothetical protein
MRRFEERMSTTHAKQIYRQRARVAEFPHAWIKSKFGLRQFRCRTRPKAACEVLFAAWLCAREKPCRRSHPTRSGTRAKQATTSSLKQSSCEPLR